MLMRIGILDKLGIGIPVKSVNTHIGGTKCVPDECNSHCTIFRQDTDYVCNLGCAFFNGM